MGVPKFYRWISERYPCLSEVVKENQIPEFDNLYLDMNGIIHTCSHPNDEDPHFRITEEQIFRDIFRYIEVLFRIIRPRKVFFMAIDGVAPRAKMNQQRGRRFMSARTAQELIEQAKRKGETLPTEERFDSNCITPGTAFMAKLHEQLKYFVNMKISTDDMWQGVRIFLSGHDVPGEGEHKIMDFIRYERSQPGYDCNTRHCLYGLDADLIMLGMCSHEPYFALLREEVKFVRPSKKNSQRTSNAEQTTFHLLHLSLLRDYLELEFGDAKENLPFAFDLESIIDDWVLMGFLVGNDFIPHLPNLHIHADALPTLYKAYKKALPELGGYINEKGFLNLSRFEKFISVLSQFDRDFFADEYEDLKWLESKSGEPHFPSRDIRQNVQKAAYSGSGRLKELVPYMDSDSDQAGAGLDGEELAASTPSVQPKLRSSSTESEDISHMPDELQDLIRRSNVGFKSSESNDNDEEEDATNAALEMKSPLAIADEDEDDDSWSLDMEKKFKEFKSDYYISKMHFDKITPDVLHDQAFQYVRAIQWNLHYYYNGIASWSWFYPHHYAPYLSDVKGFSNMEIKFELGEPFLPFQQLLAVLPAGSKKLLPTAYQSLMTDAESPLIDFYPSHFSTDLNGKKNDWEAVILIPFIEEKRLLSAMAPMNARLTDEEKARNRPGKHLLYTTAAQDQGFYRSPLMGIFPDLEHNKAMCTPLEPSLFRLPPARIRKGLLPGIRLDEYYLGFSTLKHLPYVGELRHVGVKVFEQNSKNESVIVQLLDEDRLHRPLTELADRLLGKEVFINWPHLCIGIVNGVSTNEEKCVRDKDTGDVLQSLLTTKEMRVWNDGAEEIRTKYALHRAVEVGDVTVLVYVSRLIGKKYVCSQTGEVSLVKQWGELSIPYALQTTVEGLKVRETGLLDKAATLDDLFPMESKVFLISNPFYGCEGKIVKAYDRVKLRFGVDVTIKAEPDFSRLIANQERISLYWYPGWVAAQKLDVSGHFLSRITGTIYITDAPSGTATSNANSSSGNSNRHNIGLNLKFSKKNEEVPDYTKRDGDGVWLYSSKVLKILSEYIEKFPEVCDFLHGNEGGKDMFSADDIWGPGACKQKLSDLLEWLKSLPSHGAQHQTAGTECVDERVIKAIETAVEKTKALRKKEKKLMGIRANALFRSCLSEGNASPDPRADFQLFDRVVCVREGYTVPVGYRGTVVGLHPGRLEGELKLSVIFDEEFIGGVNMRNGRNSGYQVSAPALVNLSYGVRLLAEKKQKHGEPHAQQEQTSRQQGQQVVAHAQGRGIRSDKIETRRPVALQNAPPQYPAAPISILSKVNQPASTAQKASTSAQACARPTLQKSASEAQKVSYSKALQGGKSIMNELFPKHLSEDPKPGELVFVNSSVKKDKREKEIEESSRALRSLLHVGEEKDAESKKRSEYRAKGSKQQDGQRLPTPHSGPKLCQEGPRVPFTARQPQPPPFLPNFMSETSPVEKESPRNLEEPKAQEPQAQQVAPQTVSISHLQQQQLLQFPMQMFQPQVPVSSTVQQTVAHQMSAQMMAPMQQMMAPSAGPLPFSPIVLQPPMFPPGQMQAPQQSMNFQQIQQLQKFQYLQQIQQQHLQALRAQHFAQQQQQHGSQPVQMIPPHHQYQQFNHQPHQNQNHNQYHQQQQQHNHGGYQGRQRRTSSGTGGHEQFVPMQVTKKQPAPAYVKSIAAQAVAETEKVFGNLGITESKQPSNAQTQAGGGAINKDRPTTNKASGKSKPASNSGPSTRPKSRLAINLTPAN